jgi:hypothetical protein
MNLYFINLVLDCQPSKREKIIGGALPNGRKQGYHSFTYIRDPNSGTLYIDTEEWVPCTFDAYDMIPLFFRNGIKHGLYFMRIGFILYHRKKGSPVLDTKYLSDNFFIRMLEPNLSSHNFNFLLRCLLLVGIDKRKIDNLIKIKNQKYLLGIASRNDPHSINKKRTT